MGSVSSRGYASIPPCYAVDSSSSVAANAIEQLPLNYSFSEDIRTDPRINQYIKLLADDIGFQNNDSDHESIFFEMMDLLFTENFIKNKESLIDLIEIVSKRKPKKSCSPSILFFNTLLFATEVIIGRKLQKITPEEAYHHYINRKHGLLPSYRLLITKDNELIFIFEEVFLGCRSIESNAYDATNRKHFVQHEVKMIYKSTMLRALGSQLRLSKSMPHVMSFETHLIVLV